MDDKKFMNADEIREMARDPDQWFQKARGLERCADDLWNRFTVAFRTPGGSALSPDYLEGAHMLYGMALELALKGALIRSGSTIVDFEPGFKKGKESIVSFKGLGGDHDLVGLARSAGFLDQSVHATLQDLSRCVRWLSRYPVPSNVQPSGVNPRTRVGINAQAKELLNRIIGPNAERSSI